MSLNLFLFPALAAAAAGVCCRRPSGAKFSSCSTSAVAPHESVWAPEFPISTAKKYTTIPLFGNISALEFFNFYGEASIGTPPQKFKLLFDTKENVLSIPNFQAPAPSTQAFYGHSKSSSYKADGTKFASVGMSYIFGGFLRATPSILATLRSNESFVEVTTATNFVLQRLLRFGAIGESVFAFYFYKNNKKTGSLAAATAVDAPTSAGELTIGAIDKRRYAGNIHYVSTLCDTMWMWIVLLDGVTVKGNTASDNSFEKTSEHTNRVTALVSPSFPVIGGPPEEIERLAEVVGADGDMIDCSSQGPNIVFYIEGVKLALTKDDYTLHDPDYDGNGDELCRWVFEPVNSVNFWWIGQPFLQKFYTVFDFGDDVSDKEPHLGFALAT